LSWVDRINWQIYWTLGEFFHEELQTLDQKCYLFAHETSTRLADDDEHLLKMTNDTWGL
jgi:hypothetical protein